MDVPSCNVGSTLYLCKLGPAVVRIIKMLRKTGIKTLAQKYSRCYLISPWTHQCFSLENTQQILIKFIDSLKVASCIIMGTCSVTSWRQIGYPHCSDKQGCTWQVDSTEHRVMGFYSVTLSNYITNNKSELMAGKFCCDLSVFLLQFVTNKGLDFDKIYIHSGVNFP